MIKREANFLTPSRILKRVGSPEITRGAFCKNSDHTGITRSIICIGDEVGEAGVEAGGKRRTAAECRPVMKIREIK